MAAGSKKKYIMYLFSDIILLCDTSFASSTMNVKREVTVNAHLQFFEPTVEDEDFSDDDDEDDSKSRTSTTSDSKQDDHFELVTHEHVSYVIS